MTIKRYFFSICMLTISTVGTTTNTTKNCDDKIQQAISVSLIKLISSPDKYHGKSILLMGMLSLENITAPNLGYLYFSKESMEYEINDNAITIHWSSKLRKQANPLDGKFILIGGVFDKNDRGPWSLYAGSLNCIKRLEELKNWEQNNNKDQ